jgi:hypothetical protein
LENQAKTLWARRRPEAGDEGFRFRLPKIDLGESFRIEKDYFWDAAPESRKVLLLAGLLVIWLFRAPGVRFKVHRSRFKGEALPRTRVGAG